VGLIEGRLSGYVEMILGLQIISYFLDFECVVGVDGVDVRLDEGESLDCGCELVFVVIIVVGWGWCEVTLFVL